MLELDRDRADRQVRTVSLLILAVVALGAALHYLKPVLVPFLLAVFFTHCLTPVIDLQVRYLRVPRLVAIIGAAILGLAILGLCGLLVIRISTRSRGTARKRSAWNASAYIAIR